MLIYTYIQGDAKKTQPTFKCRLHKIDEISPVYVNAIYKSEEFTFQKVSNILIK